LMDCWLDWFMSRARMRWLINPSIQ
jgi:hypothetical protein